MVESSDVESPVKPASFTGEFSSKQRAKDKRLICRPTCRASLGLTNGQKFWLIPSPGRATVTHPKWRKQTNPDTIDGRKLKTLKRPSVINILGKLSVKSPVLD